MFIRALSLIIKPLSSDCSYSRFRSFYNFEDRDASSPYAQNAKPQVFSKATVHPVVNKQGIYQFMQLSTLLMVLYVKSPSFESTKRRFISEHSAAVSGTSGAHERWIRSSLTFDPDYALCVAPNWKTINTQLSTK